MASVSLMTQNYFLCFKTLILLTDSLLKYLISSLTFILIDHLSFALQKKAIKLS